MDIQKITLAKKLIRIGSSASINQDVNIRDLILAQSASTNSGLIKEDFMVWIMLQ